MKLPRRIEEIVKRKEAFLDELRAKLEKSVIKLEAAFFERAIAEIIIRLDVKNGVLQDTPDNYRLISELDKLYNSFNSLVAGTILPQISAGTEALALLNNNYFKVTLEELPVRFEKIIASTKKITDLRLGLRGGKMVRGGFLMSMLKSDPTEFK